MNVPYYDQPQLLPVLPDNGVIPYILDDSLCWIYR